MRILEELKRISPALSVGILSADQMQLKEEIELLSLEGIRLLHFDVMDSVFVPPLTAGPFYLKSIRTHLFKDVHLMITNPETRVEEYAAAGADIITIHPESTVHCHGALQKIGQCRNKNHADLGIARGIALNPGTPVSVLDPLVSEIDIVTLLAVNPGFSGQKMIETVLSKVAETRKLFAEHQKEVLIAVDGGITRETIARVASLKPDLVVTGSAVFEGRKISENLKALREGLGLK